MRLHRFYVSAKTHQLTHKFWLSDERIISQWQRVLRFRPNQQVVLFDGVGHEKLYKILEFEKSGAHLEMMTEMVRKLPSKDIYLAWAMLKKDKNEWVLQKCTELGVNHFIPLLSERCEKTGFDENRAQKILIEAAEQCGRSNIPTLREPLHVETLLNEFLGTVPIVVCEQEGEKLNNTNIEKLVILVGPEGGWSAAEKQLFKEKNLELINIGDFTHRAETASVAITSKLL